MFTVEEVVYNLKFNSKKQDIIEAQTGKSLMAEFNQTGGLISITLLRAMFTAGLIEEADNKPVKGQKALDIYNQVVEGNGYKATVTAVVNKYTDDMGFMFR